MHNPWSKSNILYGASVSKTKVATSFPLTKLFAAILSPHFVKILSLIIVYVKKYGKYYFFTESAINGTITKYDFYD